jgi:hypothetical protein
MASEHIKRNTYYTFAFSQADAESVRRACLHLQLDPRCQRMLGSLLPGICIFRQTQASWNNAMKCKIDFVEPSRNIGPVKYEPHPFTPAIELSQAPEVLSMLNAIVEEFKKAEEREKETTKSDLDQLAMKLLRLGAEHPYVPVARLFEKIEKIRFQAQIEIRQLLDEKGLAKFEETRIGRSNMLLMDITDDGYKSLGLPIPKENKGRGSLAHRHFAHFIKGFYEQKGSKAYLEFVLPNSNHAVDVAVPLENHLVVFEVCVTSLDNALSHIKACFEDSNAVECLTFITGTQKKLKELKKFVQQNLIFSTYADRIKFDVIENYMLKELKK